MATNKELLQLARDNTIAVLEAITREPKPSYNADGQTVSWSEYRKSLLDDIMKMRVMIDAEEDDNLVEEVTRAYF